MLALLLVYESFNSQVALGDANVHVNAEVHVDVVKRT